MYTHCATRQRKKVIFASGVSLLTTRRLECNYRYTAKSTPHATMMSLWKKLYDINHHTLMNRAERRSRNAVCNCDFVGLFWKEKSQEREVLRCSSRFESKQSLEQSKYGSRQSVLEMTKTTTCTAVAAARGEKYIDRVSWVYIVKVWETYTIKCGHKCTIQYIYKIDYYCYYIIYSATTTGVYFMVHTSNNVRPPQRSCTLKTFHVAADLIE